MEDTPCLVFLELYRLYDKEAERKEKIRRDELRNLVDLCNFCALCPCPNIRSDIMKAKHAFIRRDGLNPTIRILEDVERLARVCGAYPRLTNILFEKELASGFLKRLAGIHGERKIPTFPERDFPTWAKRRKLHVKQGKKRRKVAYFAGCTGQYLFPDVPKAVVEVLQRNGIDVYYPEQKCCGMPTLLEGDQQLTLSFAAFNVVRLAEAVEEGFDIVCSCPTCGYMLKNVLSEGACYSAEYRDSVASSANSSNPQTGTPESKGAESVMLKKPLLHGLLRDEGYFASIDPVKRIKVASHTYDLGEYLRDIHRAGKLNCNWGTVSAHMAYYPPCHLREQKIGEPYAELLSLVPGISLESIEGSFYCCGIAGIMGFKKDFHRVSVEMGSRLMEKIKAMHPEKLLTDCLSCRLQFNQLTPYKVFHPIEILKEAYASTSR
jgi:glycerol-3-phosphate dehydrogenase subunit C